MPKKFCKSKNMHKCLVIKFEIVKLYLLSSQIASKHVTDELTLHSTPDVYLC